MIRADVRTLHTDLSGKLYKRTVALLADVASFRPYDDHMLSWALHIYDLHPPHPVDNPWYKTPSYYSSARKSPHTSVPRMPRSANNMSISNRHLCDSFHSLLCLSERDGLCGLWGLSFIRSDLAVADSGDRSVGHHPSLPVTELSLAQAAWTTSLLFSLFCSYWSYGCYSLMHRIRFFFPSTWSYSSLVHKILSPNDISDVAFYNLS